MTKSIIVLETLDAKEVFTGENPTLDSLIQYVRDEVADFTPDLETEKGRKEIASVAYTVTRSKTVLDTLGKDFVAVIKSKAKYIDEQRKSMREELDSLRDQVRSPLNEWEAEEKRKEEDLQARFNDIMKYSENDAMPLDDLIASLELINNTVIDGSWCHMREKAQHLKDEIISSFTRRISEREKYEADMVEIESLRKEKAEREEKERHKREASERLERENKIAAEASRKAEQDARDAEERAQRSEQRRLDDLADAKKKAETDRVEASEKAERDREEAVKAEQKRVEDERKRLQCEQETRAANKKHNAKINNEAKQALIFIGLSEQNATDAVVAICKGMVPNISIRY